MLTLRDVIQNSEQVLAKLDEVRNSSDVFADIYRISKMNSVIVWPDQIALEFFEAILRFDTQFAPGKLPASGMTIGDIIEHEGKRFITAHIGVMSCNSTAFYFARRYEDLLVSWEKNRGGLNTLVLSFLKHLPKRYHPFFPEQIIQKHAKWNETYTGFTYVGAPDLAFVKALRDLPKRCQSIQPSQNILMKAKRLESELRPYVGLTRIMANLRRQTKHAGVVRIHEGLLTLSTPAASGGASLHTQPASDDILIAIPSGEVLIIVGGQVPGAEIMHLGGGHVIGKHYILRTPRDTIFDTIQSLIDADPDLQTLWSDLVKNGYEIDTLSSWQDATDPIVKEVVKEQLPGIISNQVLGFHLDLMTTPGFAYLNPVVAQSAFEAERDLVNKAGLKAIYPQFDDFRIETSKGYGKLGDSVFAQKS